MARNHGRILASIWSDDDFRSLPPAPQRLYMFLISQPNLNHAGLIPMTLRRWAGTAAGLTVADVEHALKQLEAARFVVVDEDVEEVLVRSLVRNDGIWKQPKVMLAMEGAAREITSPMLQAALLAELARIDVASLSDEPPRSGESARVIVTGVIRRLREAFTKAPGRVSGRVSDTPSEPFEVPDAEGMADPHTCARAHSPAPAPTPTPVPPTAGAVAPRTDAAPSATPQTADQLIADWLDHVPKRPPGAVIGQVGKHIKTMLAEGIAATDIRSGLATWVSKGLHPSTLPSVVNEVMNARPVTNAPPQSRNAQIVDASLQRAIALEQRMREAGTLPVSKGAITQ